MIGHAEGHAVSKQYVVASMFLSSEASINVSKLEYDALIAAVEGVLHCTDVEEKFDGLIENYRELETYILSEALQAVFGILIRDDIKSQLLRSTTARKLSNFLSSERLYTSTVESHTSAIVNDKAGGRKVKAAMSRQYDESLNYRVMYALRNYAQHDALPVHAYSVGGSWTPDRTFLDIEFDPTVTVAELAADSEFKKETLKEIIDGPPNLRIKPMVREYVERLAAVHIEFREVTSDAINQFGATISNVKQRLKAKYPDVHDVGIAVYEADAEGNKLAPETRLSEVLFKYLTFLREKNRHLANLSKRRLKY